MAWLSCNEPEQKKLLFDEFSKGWAIGTRDFKTELLKRFGLDKITKRDGKIPHFDGFDLLFDKPIKIEAKKGRMVVFYNLNEDGSINAKSRHAGLPVIKGEKWAFNLWLRDYNFINNKQ